MNSAHRLTLFVQGAWGHAVAEHVVRHVPSTQVLSLVESVNLFATSIKGNTFVATALWRRYPLQEDLLDEACARWNVSRSSVVLEESAVRCGPAIDGHLGPCYACYRKRWLTHAVFPEREKALEVAYSRDPNCGIRGFTPASVRIAASALLLDAAEGAAARGRLRIIDLVDCNVEETHVTPVHGCSRCDTSEESGGARYVSRLIEALQGAKQ
jgi:hypothetical protein